jgi:hypothetical protein
MMRIEVGEWRMHGVEKVSSRRCAMGKEKKESQEKKSIKKRKDEKARGQVKDKDRKKREKKEGHVERRAVGVGVTKLES